MNFTKLFFGVLLGWCSLLALPWVLTEKVNPLDSAAGYVMLVPLLIPIWLLGEAGGGCRCSRFMHAQFKWISCNVPAAGTKFFIVGIAHGAIFAIPSAVMITLAIAYTTDRFSGWTILLLVTAGLVHLVLFVVSFFVAILYCENWARRIYANKKGRRRRPTLPSNGEHGNGSAVS